MIIAMLFFSMYLGAMYILTANTEHAQAEEIEVIKKTYEQGVNNIDDVYETLVSRGTSN